MSAQKIADRFRELPHQNDDSLRDLAGVPERAQEDGSIVVGCIIVGLMLVAMVVAFHVVSGTPLQPQQDQQVAEVSR